VLEVILMSEIELWESFQAFRCVRLRVQVQAIKPIHLPPFQGSMLRGAFGMALLRSACALRRQQCGTCLLRERCIYSYTFETPQTNPGDQFRRYATAPHPFVLNIETGQEELQEPGTRFTFGMTLVGRAIDFLPYFVYSFQRMGETGIGRGRGTFELLRVHALDATDAAVETVFEKGLLTMPQTVLGLTEALHSSATLSSSTLRLHFITPLRIISDGVLCRELQFPILARTLLRRLENLLAFHCNGSHASASPANHEKPRLSSPFGKGGQGDLPSNQSTLFPLGPLLDRAEAVQLKENATRWYDWERYSKRQDKRMKLGGMLGEAAFEGDIEPFLPLLVLGSWVNLGKGTTFGLGRYRLETE
jgi:hypothetical protein